MRMRSRWFVAVMVVGAGCPDPTPSDPATVPGPGTSGDEADGSSTVGTPTSGGPSTGDTGASGEPVTGESGESGVTGESGESGGTSATSEPGTDTTATSAGGCGACGGDTPYCVDDECVACDGDEACTSGSCDPEVHVCVDCLTDADCGDPDAPYCGEGKCGGCTEHAHCPVGACELDVGVCFPPDQTQVLYAKMGPEEVCGMNDCLSPATACCTVQAALDRSLELPGHTHVLVHVEAGDGPDDGGVLGMDAVHVAVRSATNAELTAVNFGSNRGIVEVDHTTGKVYLAGLDIHDANGPSGAHCTGKTVLWIDDSRIHDNKKMRGYKARGVSTENCDTTLRRTAIHDNLYNVSSQGIGTTRLRNVMLTNNLDGSSLSTLGGTTVDMLYTTIVDPLGGPHTMWYCLEIGDTVIARNSILVSTAPDDAAVECKALTISVEDSVVTAPGLAAMGAGNVIVGSPDEIPFVAFPDDVHVLGDGGVAADVARWQPGDPATDIDGDKRPGAPDSPDVAGADVP